ncbi:MAG: hypothetical protein ACYC8T_33150 [Myxococcaceae bacterium]
MKKLALCTAAALLSGCLTPRSVVVGQTAAPVGAGATEVGLATGFAYQSEMAPGYLTRDITGTRDLYAQKLSRGFSLPAFEANGQIGVSELVAVNLHASSAGIQPGAKITLNRGFGQVALLPEVAFGYGSSAASTFLTGQDGKQSESDPGATTSLNFLAGLKVIASHRMGLYGALGYDLQLSNAVTTGTSGVGGSAQATVNSVGSVQHNFTGAIGFDWKMGQVHLRPELAAAITPGISVHLVNGPDVSDNSGGLGFLIMPTLTLAVASDPKRDDSGIIEDEKNIGDTDGGDEAVPPRPEEREERREEQRDERQEELREE